MLCSAVVMRHVAAITAANGLCWFR